LGVSPAEADKGFIQRVRDLKYDIQLHSIDIEDTDPRVSISDRISITHELINFFVGFCPTELYTAEWYWEQYMNNTSEFNFMPLWYAWYPKDELPRLQIPTERQFGGWTIAKTHQYIGNTYFAGIWCDVNYYEGGVVIPPEEPTIIKVSANKLYRFEVE